MIHGVLKKLLLLVFISISFVAAAQKDSMRISKSFIKPSFHMLLNAGLLTGKSGRDFEAQVVPQVSYRTWRAGVGGGLDYYYWRTILLFVDVRKTLSKPHSFFLYGDGGLNIPWIKKQNTWYQQQFKTGLYYDAGGGWNFKLNKQNGLWLSAGYSTKNINEIRTTNVDKTKLEYDLRRLSFKIGFQF